MKGPSIWSTLRGASDFSSQPSPSPAPPPPVLGAAAAMDPLLPPATPSAAPPPPATVSEPAPASHLPQTATLSDAALAGMVAATHVGQKRWRAGKTPSAAPPRSNSLWGGQITRRRRPNREAGRRPNREAGWRRNRLMRWRAAVVGCGAWRGRGATTAAAQSGRGSGGGVQ